MLDRLSQALGEKDRLLDSNAGADIGVCRMFAELGAVLADLGVVRSGVEDCGEKRFRREGDSFRIEEDSATRAALVASSGALPERE